MVTTLTLLYPKDGRRASTVRPVGSSGPSPEGRRGPLHDHVAARRPGWRSAPSGPTGLVHLLAIRNAQLAGEHVIVSAVWVCSKVGEDALGGHRALITAPAEN